MGDGDRGELAVRGDSSRPGRWASLTKPVTALAVLVAVEEEVVHLDEPAGPPGATVRHLLAHASGLAFDDGRILAEPGKRRIYSNVGYEALAEAMAQRSGMPFAQYLVEAVLEPLGMAATRLDGGAAAGLVGPLDDLVRLAGELLSPTLVSTRTLDEATTVAFPGLAGVLPGFGRYDPLDWGLGFELRAAKAQHAQRAQVWSLGGRGLACPGRCRARGTRGRPMSQCAPISPSGGTSVVSAASRSSDSV